MGVLTYSASSGVVPLGCTSRRIDKLINRQQALLTLPLQQTPKTPVLS
jgi:hypothetical protein